MACREDFDSIQEITRFKTAAGWGADPMKAVESKTKAAFTRTFNKAGLAVRTTIMVEDGKKTKRAAPAPAEPDEFGGELADVRALSSLQRCSHPIFVVPRFARSRSRASRCIAERAVRAGAERWRARAGGDAQRSGRRGGRGGVGGRGEAPQGRQLHGGGARQGQGARRQLGQGARGGRGGPRGKGGRRAGPREKLTRRGGECRCTCTGRARPYVANARREVVDGLHPSPRDAQAQRGVLRQRM